MAWGRSLFWSLIAAVASVLIWQSINEPLPHLATSDIYTHLSVTRHLDQGDGFVTDVTYPLSFAYPFAQKLPQPLIHRSPGFAVLLQIPYATAGGNDHLTLTHVRIMQLAILGLIVFFGAVGYLKRKRGRSLLPWLVFLLANPLMGYAVNWSFVELACALLLLVIWLRGRDVGPKTVGPLDGLLAGILALLRFDLFWVPWLWFIWWRSDRLRETPGPRFFNGRLLGAMVVFVLVMAPWTVRNIKVTGQPFFSLQAQAELVKMTPAWPEYSVYKQLQPQPLWQTVQEHPKAALGKAAHGLVFFLKNHHRFMPWMLFWAGAIPALIFSFALIMHGVLLVLFRKQIPGVPIIPDKNPSGPNLAAFITFALLCLQYSFFDHDLRHLLVLLPILLWEISMLVGEYAGKVARRNTAPWHARINPLMVGIIGLVVSLLIVFLFPCQLPGWENSAKDARLQGEKVAHRIAWVKANRVEVLFDGTSAVPWFVNQPAVWSPANEEIRNRIRELLSKNNIDGD